MSRLALEENDPGRRQHLLTIVLRSAESLLGLLNDILGLSPRTVNKHLEHVYVKLGVETRTAAAAVAIAASH